MNTFKSNFEDGINVLFMQSDGGLTSMEDFTGSRAILSGPAGGVVGKMNHLIEKFNFILSSYIPN